MTSIRKAKKAFKRNPYYKGRKVKTFVWYKVRFENKGSHIKGVHIFTKWRFFYKKLAFRNYLFHAKVSYVGFDDLKRYKENLAL